MSKRPCSRPLDHASISRSRRNYISLSKDETILLSSCGDVVTCRSRESAYPNHVVDNPHYTAFLQRGNNKRSWNGYEWEPLAQQLTVLCCEADCDELSHQLQDGVIPSSLCGSTTNVWLGDDAPVAATTASHPPTTTKGAVPNMDINSTTRSTATRTRSSGSSEGGGLLGGSPADVASPFLQHNHHAPHQHEHHNHHTHKPASATYYREGSSSGREQQATLPFRNLNGASPNKRESKNIARSEAVVENDGDDNHNNDNAGDIVQIRSFDYSHYFGVDDGNDMLPDAPQPGSSKNQLRAERTYVAEQSSSFKLPSNQSNGYTLMNDESGGGLTRGPSSTYPQQDHNAYLAHKDEGVLSNQQQGEEQTQQQPQDSFFHGIPTLFRSFASVRIIRLSAHPLGSHVLLISNAGLLYSYGLNNEGQLGIGVKTSISGYHRGYITTPTIVTPLVENGGKAIACAAGVNHSLVVVQTEERRLVKSQSFDPQRPSSSSASSNVSSRSLDQARGADNRNNNNSYYQKGNHHHSFYSNTNTETVVHHQIYGFGRNDSLKIGLINPKVALINGMEESVESVVLPRRVALRCRVQQLDDDTSGNHYNYNINNNTPIVSSSEKFPPMGVFDIQASAEHSAALVHRSSGQIELYTWGNATFGALGSMPGQPNRSPKVPVNVVPVPSFVASLSQCSHEEAQASCLLLEGEYPMSCSLGRRSSFVLTSFGRCFSFGTSDEGMLGLGPKITEVSRPSEIALPAELRGEGLTSVSAGASHVLACTESGRVLAWGSKVPCGFHLSSSSQNNNNNNNNNGDSHSIQWSPKQVEFTTSSGTKSNKLLANAKSKSQDYKIAHVGAGYDCSVFVTESGRVLSCGRYSGRLGLGEFNPSLLVTTTTTSSDAKGGGKNNKAAASAAAAAGRVVVSPRPLLGGLRLWQDHEAASLHYHPQHHPATPHSQQQQRRKTPLMKRGMTIS